ncbi:MAG: alpha/beta hydrolase fold domain-containing protein [Planctomycetales bacterium]
MLAPRFRLVCLVVLAAVSACFAQDKERNQQPTSPNRRKPTPENSREAAPNFAQRLKAADKNGDGNISKTEAPEGLKRNFDRVDLDQDGFLDEAELKKLAERFRSRSRRPDPRGRLPILVPDNVKLTVDVAYRQGNDKWRLDLATPKESSDTPRPVIVFVHGGGWRGGDKGSGLWRSLPLKYAERGYVCASVNYRLTGEAPFPACVEDVKCAVRWLRANAEKHNLEPQRIGD